MPPASNFTFKMDENVREEFNNLCDAIGITMSAAINALVRQAIRDQELSFSLRDKGDKDAAGTKDKNSRKEELL